MFYISKTNTKYRSKEEKYVYNLGAHKNSIIMMHKGSII